MIKSYYLSFVFLCCAVSFGYGQTDDFTDGNFTLNPVWSGDTANFSVLTNGTLPNGSAATDGSFLGSNASTGSIAITTPSTEVSEWEFSLGSPNFNPSSSNSFGVVLMSNTAVTGNITGSSWNGYYLKIGVDASADRIELWRKNGAGFGLPVGDFPSSPIVASGALRNGLNIRVTRSALGEFELFYSTGFTYPATPTTSAGTLTNNDITTSNFFGIYSKFNNASTSRRVYIDNIVLGGIVSTDTSLEFETTSSSLAEDGLFIDVCVEITNPSATTATSVDIALNGSSTATNGSDYDDGAGIPAAIAFPQTLTFPAGSSANQCLTIFISNDDILIEGNETVVLDLINPSGGTSAALGTNDQHILTITDNDAPAIADVIITEIMYNSAGTDDEWIEICNVSGSPQVLNDYTVRYNGTVLFTFPSTGVIIADGACITVSLGSNGSGTFNIDCPFTPDYGIGALTNDTNNLINSSATISLVASDGTSTIDSVTYDDGDGADNTGESLHVIDASIDNSVTSSNYWEVINGGSPGTNSLISPCTPVGPEINLEGSTGNFPDISIGNTPSIFDGTDFGTSNVGTGLTNTFRIENFGGTTDLAITSVIVLSGDVADFSITALPSSPIAALGSSNFDIEFNPIVAGTRTAIIQIISNDADESPYTFNVTGEGLCVTSPITALPTSGPVNTIVTVTGTNLATATASINGAPAMVNNISGTTMEVTIPEGANTGNLEIFDNIGCTGISPFTVINSENSSCEGSGGIIPTDLFISEITDATSQTLSYIELYNGTGSAIDLRDYSIAIRFNGNPVDANNVYDILGNGGSLINGMLPDGQTYVLSTDVDASGGTNTACTTTNGANGSLTDEDTGLNGVNARPSTSTGNGGSDCILLYKDFGAASEDIIDVWGDCNDDAWSRSILDSDLATDNIHFDSYVYDPGPGNLNVNIEGMGVEGFNFKRSSFAGSLPNDTFNKADWVIYNWLDSENDSSNQTPCIGDNYDDIGLFDFSVGSPPLFSSILSTTTACNESTISVTASQGFAGGNTLEYHWYYYNPAQSGLGWQTITNGGIYTTADTSPDLTISDATSVLTYQFYCEVREDDATCYSASEAIQITVSMATWDGMDWIWNDGTTLNTVPSLATFPVDVILTGPYNTALGGAQSSFGACNLFVDNVSLNIDNGDFVEVENNLNVNGTSGSINIEPEGSFVQINDSGIVSATVTTNITVNKITAPSNNWYEYTYWSSPVFEETPANGLTSSNPNRRFQFNAQYFRDSTYENTNDDSINNGAGIDDIDDQAPFDWGVIATPFLVPGVGYASTHDPLSFASAPDCPGPTCHIRYTFSGLFNNGIITVPMYRNDTELNDNNWNFVGNPYASAISADVFLATNMGLIDENLSGANQIIDGAIYLWSQNTAPTDTTNGNENVNFSQSDYAIINGTGQTAAQTNGGDATVPSRHIPSGQGFFISMANSATATQVLPSPIPGEDIQTADLTFNNAMRVTGNNNQFFRNATQPNLDNKLWINLSSDNGVFSQVLIGYLNNATDDYDGMFFDAPRNASTGVNSIIYTLIPNAVKKFAIQGKNTSSITIEESIPLGFYTSIDEATIYTFSIAQLEGDFMIENAIYVIDKLYNTIHELSASDFTFTSETGEFNNRFEIVFRADALSIGNQTLDSNDLTVTEFSDGNVQFSIGHSFTITNVKILDVAGRQVYNLKGNSSTERYNLSRLSKAAYIAKVTLSNGQVISKKAIKQH
jgi:hypothetical protein